MLHNSIIYIDFQRTVPLPDPNARNTITEGGTQSKYGSEPELA